MQLFRAISQSERASIERIGKLTTTENSCEGKHLATTHEHARSWGTALFGTFSVVEVNIAENHEGDLYFIAPNLDMIGPAYFAAAGLLEYFSIVRFHD